MQRCLGICRLLLTCMTSSHPAGEQRTLHAPGIRFYRYPTQQEIILPKDHSRRSAPSDLPIWTIEVCVGRLNINMTDKEYLAVVLSRAEPASPNKATPPRPAVWLKVTVPDLSSARRDRLAGNQI